MKTKDTETTYNSNITKEDLQALGTDRKNIHQDQGDDQILQDRTRPVDFAAEDLDIPGRVSSQDQTQKMTDEENKHFSLGSDDNDQLEQRTDA